MEFRFTPEEEAFRGEVRQFIDQELSPEFRGLALTPPDGDEAYAEEVVFRRKLGGRGWLAVDWPAEYGGSGRSFMLKYLLAWEMKYAGAPYPLTAVDIVAPTLMQYGTEWQKREYLPRIARGEIDFALGYTEPDAGTDLASLKTRAVRAHGHYVIEGQKVFTSFSHRRDYVWLAARTRDDGPKHMGISLFIVPTDAPGVSIRPMVTMDGECAPQTFYQGVQVPSRDLVGRENEGWRYLVAALGLERLVVYPAAQLQRFVDELQALVRRTATPGPAACVRLLRDRIAEMAIEARVAAVLSHRAAWQLCRGVAGGHDMAVVKTFNSEVFQRLASLAAAALGLYGQLGEGSPRARLDGRAERLYRSSMMVTFGAGSNEVQRLIIATQGLGLPR